LETQCVGGKKPNDFNLYDMIGNVWEWVEDEMHDNYVGAPINGDAWIRDCAVSYYPRIIRGGSVLPIYNSLRSACREFVPPETTSGLIGFRIVMELK
jgi:formylglycine-generating enzyme required for sulfatase activity